MSSLQKIPHFKPFGKTLYFNRLELESWLLQNPIKTIDEIEANAQTYITANRKGGKR